MMHLDIGSKDSADKAFPLGTLTKSEDPDEMPQKVAFHQGLHCLLM